MRLRRRRLAKTGNVLVKANTAAIVTLSVSGETSFAITPTIGSFSETTPFLTAFENYRIRRVICRVRPNFNIGWAGTSGVGTTLAPYVIAAYHKAVATSSTLTIANILSLDKHKYVQAYRGTRMAFTPAVQTTITQGSTGDAVYQWKPLLSTNASPQHYCGVICWPADGGAGANPASYTVELQAHIEFMNQKISIN